MPDALPYLIGAAAALGVWWLGLVRLGVFTPQDVSAWRRLAALRGHSLPRTRLEKAVRRSRALQRVQSELDLEQLLADANRPQSPLGYAGRVAALALCVFAGTLFADALVRGLSGSWAAPPWIAVILGVLVLPLSLFELRQSARRTRDDVERTLGDMLMQVAVITDTRGLQLHDAARRLSRCARSHGLATLIDDEGYRRLVHERFRSTAELYRAIGAAYRIELFTQLADTVATTNVGVPEREAYTRLALAVCQRRLTDARVRAARSRILVTLPVAGMLVPLLILIAAPTFQAITSGLGGG
ncbi:MAG: hypothetical protein JOY80_10140 [Candidatus Dormibacteraeota bacterium]|nr:hypothetical protein [Candidatus Dormibacteraeota bacterium]